MKAVRASALGYGLGALSVLLLGILMAGVPESRENPGEPDPDHTFSVVAMDPETGEVGVAVTTRNACVGNRVPWVRAGVGAVATQASTRPEYGPELLDGLEEGLSPAEALSRALAQDDGADQRQVAVVGVSGETAQHTGSGPGPWAGQRAGVNFATQGNVLAGPAVLDEVVRIMEETAGSGRPLADRLVAALEAGHAAGGDRRKGRRQSAAVLVADSRPGMATRPDGQSVFLHICEAEEPVRELRRQYEAVSQTLGYRTLQQYQGADVWQLKVILHALGYFGRNLESLEREAGWNLFTAEAAAAVDEFRRELGLSTPEDGGTPPGWVDRTTIQALWGALEEEGRAVEIRKQLRPFVHIRN